MGERHHIQDVGRILLQAQRDVAQLRSSIARDDGGSDADAKQQALVQVMEKVEHSLKLKSDAVLSTSMGYAVAALPALDDANFRAGAPRPADGAAPRNLLDPSRRARPPPRRPSSGERGVRMLPPATVKGQLQAHRTQKAFDDPTSAVGRQVLEEQFGIPRASSQPRRARSATRLPKGQLALSKTTQPAGVVEREARTNPQAPPPPIRPEDVSRGLLSMVNRGLIPGHADMTPAIARVPAPAMQAPARMHSFDEKFDKHSGPAYTSPFGFNAANVRLDLLTGVGESLRARELREAREEAEALARGEVAPSAVAVVNAGESLPMPAPGGGEAGAEAAGAGAAFTGDARGFEELMDTFSLHHFIIRRGELLDDTPEFVSYQRKNQERWGALLEVINGLKELMAEYAVPLAYVDGKRVIDLAMDALGTRSERELLGCLVNAEQVEAHMRQPGARYRGTRARAANAAATLIQAEARRRHVAKHFAFLRAQQAAAFTIARGWRFFCDRTATRKAISERRAREQAAWEAMTAQFWREWPRIRRSKRVLIHLPSLSYSERQRRTIGNIDVRQNAQMPRLCDVRDPNVEIVYVAPFPLNEETLSYFQKVLQIGGVQQPDKRFRVVVPENYHRFPATYSLATLLYYSPRALRRIANFCRAKEAYIVPNVVGLDELRLSMRLAVPLLATEPRIAAIYSTKSGSKRIFQSAQVNVPPGAHDLYDEDDLIGSLAHLIAHNLDVPKWVFKVDDEFGGRGHAHFLAADLPSYAQLLRRYDTDPRAWSEDAVQKVVQELIASELEETLPFKTVIASKWLFSSWVEFMAAFSRSGGVIEASPLEVRSTPSVNLLIEPDGTVSLTSTHEQLLRGDYSFIGAAFPQTSVPHPALRDAALAIGRACFAKSIIGHVGVDMIAFVDEKRLLRVWAVDLNLRLTQSALTFNFFHFLMDGSYDDTTGVYYGKPPPGLSEEEKLKPRDQDRRSYMMNELLYHPELSNVHHTAFFNICRLKGISFDLQNNTGTIFNLLDSFASGVLSVVTVGRNHLEALKLFTDCLDFLQKEIGSSTEEVPFANGFVETGLKDVVDSVKVLVERHKKYSRPPGAAQPPGARPALPPPPASGGGGKPSPEGEAGARPASHGATADAEANSALSVSGAGAELQAVGSATGTRTPASGSTQRATSAAAAGSGGASTASKGDAGRRGASK